MSLPFSYRILGFDSSKACTGWCIVDVNGGNYKIIDYGYISTAKIKDHGEVLILIDEEIRKIMDKYNPNYIAAEQMFAGKNRQTSMALAQIHGITLLNAAKKKIPVTYYAVMSIKSIVLGGIKTKKEDGTKKTGEEMKQEVADKVLEVFGKENFNKEYTNDVTDAISASYCFILMNGEPVTKKKNK